MLAHPYDEMLLSNKKEPINDACNNLNVLQGHYTQEEKASNLKGLHIVPFHLHNTLEMIKLQKWKTDQKLPKDKDSGGAGEDNWKGVAQGVFLW